MKTLKHIIARCLPDKYRRRLPWVKRAYANLPPFVFSVPTDTVAAVNRTSQLHLMLKLTEAGYMKPEDFLRRIHADNDKQQLD